MGQGPRALAAFPRTGELQELVEQQLPRERFPPGEIRVPLAPSPQRAERRQRAEGHRRAEPPAVPMSQAAHRLRVATRAPALLQRGDHGLWVAARPWVALQGQAAPC